MVNAPMDALSYSLRFDTTGLAHRVSVREERHPPHLQRSAVTASVIGGRELRCAKGSARGRLNQAQGHCLLQSWRSRMRRSNVAYFNAERYEYWKLSK
jgi:hypothetical protein